MGARVSQRRNLIILSLALVVVMLGFGMVVPIFPFYVQRMGAGGGAFGLLVATAALTELIFGPLWGSLSDRTGRKPILLIGMFGYAWPRLRSAHQPAVRVRVRHPRRRRSAEPALAGRGAGLGRGPAGQHRGGVRSWHSEAGRAILPIAE